MPAAIVVPSVQKVFSNYLLDEWINKKKNDRICHLLAPWDWGAKHISVIIFWILITNLQSRYDFLILLGKKALQWVSGVCLGHRTFFCSDSFLCDNQGPSQIYSRIAFVQSAGSIRETLNDSLPSLLSTYPLVNEKGERRKTQLWNCGGCFTDFIPFTPANKFIMLILAVL